MPRLCIAAVVLFSTPYAVSSDASKDPDDAEGQNKLAMEIWSKSPDDALRLVLKAAEQGHTEACFNAATFYHRGVGTQPDREKAERWLLKAAKKGHGQSAFLLGQLHQAGQHSGAEKSSAGHGKGDMKEAERWFQVAAKSGDRDAQYNLGVLLFRKKLADGEVRDERQVAEWWEKAASQGHMEASFNLGGLYEAGTPHMEKDEDMAAKWYKIAAKGGHREAQYSHGMILLGRKKFDKAYNWLRKSADQKHAYAAWGLVFMCREGLGTDKDDMEAWGWIEKAANYGHKEAKTLVETATKQDKEGGDASELVEDEDDADEEDLMQARRRRLVRNIGSDAFDASR